MNNNKLEMNKYEQWIKKQNVKAAILTGLLFLIMAGIMYAYTIIVVYIMNQEKGDFFIIWMVGLILYPILFFVPLLSAKIYAGYQKENSYKSMGPDAFAQYIKRLQDFNQAWYGKEGKEQLSATELITVIEKINQKQLPYEKEKIDGKL